MKTATYHGPMSGYSAWRQKENEKFNRRAGRALERRFGQSLMPYEVFEESFGVWRCADVESGSWIKFMVRSNGRLRVVGEHDGVA